MNKTYLLALAAALVAAPAALAHDPAGTPKNYCEDPSEWGTHDYGPPGTGNLIFLGQDGNLAGDCNGDAIPADYDGHIEFAFGGGWLSADSGDGATTGSIFCFGEEAHHPFFGPITVTDVVFSTTVPFSVASDFISVVPPTGTENCGDFESDDSTPCVGTCSVTFPPGLDGTYQVYVGDATGGGAQAAGTTGILGHITTAVVGGPLCVDTAHTFSGPVGTVNKIAGCTTVQVTSVGQVTVNFNVGPPCVVVGSASCSWGAATSFTLAPTIFATGTWQQTL